VGFFEDGIGIFWYMYRGEEGVLIGGDSSESILDGLVLRWFGGGWRV
jgi:hypothetical protein